MIFVPAALYGRDARLGEMKSTVSVLGSFGHYWARKGRIYGSAIRDASRPLTWPLAATGQSMRSESLTAGLLLLINQEY